MRFPFEAIRALVLAAPGVSGVLASRVYFMAVPQNAEAPYALIYPVAGNVAEPLEIVGGAVDFRFSIDIRSQPVTGASSANEIGALVFNHLQGFTGTVAGVAIDRIIHVSDALYTEDGSKLSRRILDFRVFLL